MSKNSLLEALAPERKTFNIFGADVLIQELSLDAFIRFGEMQKTDKSAANALLISECVIDSETGDKMFSQDEAFSVMKSSKKALEIVAAILDVSGMSSEKKA